MPWCRFGGQWSSYGSQFSPTMWVLGTKPRFPSQFQFTHSSSHHPNLSTSCFFSSFLHFLHFEIYFYFDYVYACVFVSRYVLGNRIQKVANLLRLEFQLRWKLVQRTLNMQKSMCHMTHLCHSLAYVQRLHTLLQGYLFIHLHYGPIHTSQVL